MSRPLRFSLGDLDERDAAIRVGPFELGERIGSGSMGQVWRATHRIQQIDVALKVLSQEHATDDRFQRAFRREVRSMGELDHPSVITVYGYGTIDDRAEESSFGELRAHTPYMAMEYAPFGSLADLVDGTVSPRLATIIAFALLDAFAHSHARGVIHRDIKPANILFVEHHGVPRPTLADFGLGYAIRDADGTAWWRRPAGTPRYMTPEQLTGDWRNYTPPTDLYALGCLIWKLLTGRPVYDGANAVQIAQKHLEAPIPPLPDDVDTRDQFEPWLHRLLQKDPGDRFQSAAEAALALAHIGSRPVPGEFRGEFAALVGKSQPAQNADLSARSLTPVLDPLFETKNRPPGRAKTPPLRTELNSPPADWRRRDGRSRRIRMSDTGHQLFELRRVPFTARSDERDHLWKQFRRSVDEEAPTATLVSGAAGIGKDRLAEWLCNRVSELDAGRVFHCYHEAADELADGLIRMIRREFRLRELEQSEVEQRFADLLPESTTDVAHRARQLAELVTSRDDTPQIYFPSPARRHVAIARLLQTLSRRQPVVLWLNDVQWGLESLHFLNFLFSADVAELRLYVVMTAREDILADHPRHRDEIDDLLRSPRVDHLELGPLDEDTIHELVESALFLEPSTAFEVARRSGGNPLYALETVGSWIDAGLVEPTRNGFRLRENTAAEVPDEWLDVWSAVAERIAASESDQIALEVGAILGEQINRDVWRCAVESLGVSFSDRLVETLLRRRYIHDTPHGLVFSQNLLRDALFAQARRAGRHRRLCLAAARAIDEHSDKSEPVVDERVGFLLLEASRPVEAAGRLVEAARFHARRRHHRQVVHLSQSADRALGGLDDRPSDVLRLHADALELLCNARHGIDANAESIEIAERGLTIAEALEDLSRIGLLAARQVAPLYVRGHIERAIKKAHRAVDCLDDISEPRHAAARLSTQTLLADIHARQGDFDDAMAVLDDARQRLDEVDDPITVAQHDFTSVKIRYVRGDEISRTETERLVERCRRLGIAKGEQFAANLRAELARDEEEFDEALRWYRQVIDRFEDTFRGPPVVQLLNLALISLQQGDFTAAGQRAEEVLQQLRRTKRPQMELYARAAMLPMLIANDDERLKEVVDRIDEITRELQLAEDADLKLCFEAALELLDGDGDNAATLTQLLQRVS